ncbi:MAG: hypothetical protein MI784_02585, partial [Cytophagales bacterium]|nr:hypothetical protein [Cytophagales bacterium]
MRNIHIFLYKVCLLITVIFFVIPDEKLKAQYVYRTRTFWFNEPGTVNGSSNTYSPNLAVAFSGCDYIFDMDVYIAWNSGGSSFSNSDFYVEMQRAGGTPVVLVNDASGTRTGDTNPTYIGTNSFSAITLFDDEAATSSTGRNSPSPGEYRPYAALTAYDGMDPNANWNIHIEELDGVTPPPTSDAINIDSVGMRIICRIPCNIPTIPAFSYPPPTCVGDSIDVTFFGGALNDATHWVVSSGSCGGTRLDSTVALGTITDLPIPTNPTVYYFGGSDGDGCVDESNSSICTIVTITVPNTREDPSFTYSSTDYCITDADPSPTITGMTGGTFSSTPGLALNSTTGEIDLSASTPGTYAVTYVTSTNICRGTRVFAVSVHTTGDSGFSYGSSQYCLNVADPLPATVNTPGGTFSGSAPGIVVDPSSGAIDLSSSVKGNYTVDYNVNPHCPLVTTRNVELDSADNASFHYSDTVFCTNGVDPSATVTGLAGGVFSGTSGLVINTSTGEIDVAASTLGEHTVRYITSGTCPDTSDLSILISVPIVPSLSYPSPAYCLSGTDPLPSVTGVMGGSFSSGSGLSINASTGEIDLSASTLNTYTVTYTGPVTCPSSGNTTVTLSGLDDPSFNYSDTVFCTNGVDPSATVTGLPGGTFSGSSGLSINASTGEIDVAASTLGEHTARYITSGACPDTSNLSILISVPIVPSLSYPSPAYCLNAADPVPAVTGVMGGSFSAGSGLSLNASTGEID